MFFTLILFAALASQGQTKLSDSTYTEPLWRARLVYADALRLRVALPLIDSLESRNEVLQAQIISDNSNWNDLYNTEQELNQLNREQLLIEIQVKEHYKKEARRMKRGRNVVIGIAILAGTVSVLRPP